MSALELLLYTKILITLFTCVVPMLMLPARRVMALYHIGADAVPLVRLYGVALLALLVGYGSGVVSLWSGAIPWGILWMGIVSNLGATVTMGLTGAWRKAPPLAAIFGGIGLALCAVVIWPEPWVRPLVGAVTLAIIAPALP